MLLGRKDSKTLDKGKGYCCRELELRLRRKDEQEQMEGCIKWKEKYAAFVKLMPVCMESIVRCSYIISCDRPLAVQVVGPKRASTGPLHILNAWMLAQLLFYLCALNTRPNKTPSTLQMLHGWTDTITLTGNDFLKTDGKGK